MNITRPFFRVFSPIVVLFFSMLAARGQDNFTNFSPGDRVVLKDDTSLYFNMKILRNGHKGEIFTVIQFKPDADRLWVSAKDSAGNAIALNFPASEASPLPPERPLVPMRPVPADEKTPPPSALNADVTAKVSKATYLVTTDLGEGSAFLVKMQDQVYLVTNYHVLEGSSTIQCANQFDSFKISDGPIEVADERDLVRIPMDKKEALEISDNTTTDDAVAAFGNSGGKDVVTKLDGKVLGVGPQEMEVSCEFIPGNSGGPIADSKGNVAAIATYVARNGGVPDWVKKGTRFEGTRRFGVRLTNDLAWSKTTLQQFQKETKTLDAVEGMLDDFLNIASNIANTPFEKPISVKYATDQPVLNIVDSYNKDSRDAATTGGRPVADDDLGPINRRFYSRAKTQFLDLARAIRDDSATTAQRNLNAFTIPHVKTQNTAILGDMRDLADFLEKNAESLSPPALFHLQNSEKTRPGDSPVPPQAAR